MSQIIYFVLGFLAASLIVYWLMHKSQPKPLENEPINPEQIRKHKANLGQIGGYIASRGQITNDEVEKLLGVSNATAERYLNELEQQGKIEQVGVTGQSVYYRLK